MANQPDPNKKIDLNKYMSLDLDPNQDLDEINSQLKNIRNKIKIHQHMIDDHKKMIEEAKQKALDEFQRTHPETIDQIRNVLELAGHHEIEKEIDLNMQVIEDYRNQEHILEELLKEVVV